MLTKEEVEELVQLQLARMEEMSLEEFVAVYGDLFVLVPGVA